MKKIIIIAVVIIIAAVALFFLVLKKPGSMSLPFSQKAQEKTTTVETNPGIGGQLFDQVQKNPVEKLPDTNPFDNNINPYKDAYINPFQ